VAATLRAIEAGSELAGVVAEKADAPNLTGPARALSRRAHNDVEGGLATPPPRRHPRQAPRPAAPARRSNPARGQRRHDRRHQLRLSRGHTAPRRALGGNP